MLTLCPTTGINHSPGNFHYLHINAGMGLPAPLFSRRRETSPNMRAALALLLLLAAAYAEHRGKGIYHVSGALLSPRDEGDEAGVC